MMNKLLCLIVSMLFLGVTSVFAGAPANYGLVWSDEFTTGPINTNDWTYDVGTGPQGDGWGNFEQEFYTNGTNFQIDSGYGKLIAKKESFSGSNYTSCRMNTKGKKAFKYGYFEAKLRAPTGNGLWTAVWTLGADADGVGWPSQGEIELYEQRTGSVKHGGTTGDNCFIQTCHYAKTYGAPWSSSLTTYNAQQTNYTECLCRTFHTYAILWDSLGYTFYFDDKKSWQSPDINQPNNFKSFHQPHFLIANIAIGGNYTLLDGGLVDNSIFPQTMAIDYIRVYQKGATQAKPGEHQSTLENFSLVNQASATLKVFSLKGELVADLTDNLRAMKGGENAVRKSMCGLGRGAYVVRCMDDNRTISQKVVITK
jgi:beta-glucanase (GH16 family)